jgi:hypothetical protein
MAAEFDFSEWVDYFGLNTKSAKTLQKAGLTDYNALVGVDENDMEALGLPISQFKCLRAAVDSIRPKISHKETPRKAKTAKGAIKTHQPSPDPPKPKSAGKGKQQDHLATLLAVQQSQQSSDDESDYNPLTSEHQGAYFDPRAVLTVKARKAEVTHIIDFLTEDVIRRRRLANKNEENAYFNISMEEWGAANCRLMSYLLQQGKLSRKDIDYYLAYTTKIYDMASKFTWQSILFFDRQYREVQAEFNMQWGTFAPQLEYQLLQPKANPNAPRRTPQLATASRLQEECRNFRSKGVCSYGDNCKFRHVVIDVAVPENNTKAKNGQ